MSEVIEETKEAKLVRWQKERVERAAGADYTFEYHAGIKKWLCKKADGSLPYVLTEEECGCPDDGYRARPANLACKHRCALAIYLMLNGHQKRG